MKPYNSYFCTKMNKDKVMAINELMGMLKGYKIKEYPEDISNQIEELNKELDVLVKATAVPVNNAPTIEEDEWYWDVLPDNRKLLVGTWYLVASKDGPSVWVSKTKPDKVGGVSGFRLPKEDKVGFLCLTEDSQKFYGEPYKSLRREDFNQLDLPEVTWENSPLEIEIMPSGEVYFY